jgi:hypothetical protein
MQTHPTPPNIRRKSKGVNAEKRKYTNATDY